jgi:membrane-associated phospholipid phosphatase
MAEPRNPRLVLLRRSVLAAALLTFGLLAAAVPPDGPLGLEQAALEVAHASRTDTATLAMAWVTHLGDGWFVVALTLVGTALITRRSRLWGGFFGVAVLGASAMSQVFKYLVARARPPEPLAMASGFAFPSGHAMGTAALFLGLFFVTRALFPRMQWAVAAVGAALVVAVGASRVYLGVHYPSDVVAGWALGTAWVVLLSGLAAAWAARERAALTPPAAPGT